MSSAIVKKCLELFKDDLKTETPTSVKKKKKTVDAMKLISSKNTGTWKELRRLQKQQRSQRRKQTKQTKSLIEIYQDRQHGDFTEHNISMLQKLSHAGKLKTNQAKMILEQNDRHRRRPKTEERKTEEKSIFTDKDFEKFEQEYNFTSQ
ncbi:active regulator of SIRT1-like [Gigantopelta aegis]|uniref:active regulator of SIRT1-like n=1 Tax=Gigantopelta aegis TaxID=1735272 RepID=UPI001B88B7F6|nr:active regulator of SIRT1-like [Gigantopelta aegis]